MMLKLVLFSFICPTSSYLTTRAMSSLPRMNTKLLVKRINIYEPKTESQEEYVKMLDDSRYKMIVANGAAGTGKTLLACQSAIKELYDGDKDKIIITRPVVPVEEDIGFLPGTLNKKMDPWTRPIMDIFNDFHSKNNIKNMMKDNTIEISPLGFMRGRTFKNAFIIADEMQNCSPNQMIMLLTRLGENSKIVITGDLKQCDKEWSGLKDLLEKLELFYNDKEIMKKDGIGIIEFTNLDVQRSELVSKILKIYNQ
jgi:phosphate starvation-inducible protein PhoH and related proteins|uniref:PhoH-like protein n=1 Tax=viral metagenome TaxID=1070528 RepID=A0A6C0CZT2_9ZZZZ